MFSIHKIVDAGAAFIYFRDRDDYYLSDAASAEWWGTSAERLGLAGAVDAALFRNLLDGRVAGQQVGRAGFRDVAGLDGYVRRVPNHAAGYDVTFSASKSFSVAALVHRDERLVVAHDRAVRAAMAYVEQQAALTRQRAKDGTYVYRPTDGLVGAMFRHSTSRDHDPQLHTHVVVANVTWDETTQRWVSLWSRDGLYRIHTQAESIYQNQLAAAAREAGYHVQWSVDDHGYPSFELAEISEQERILFSQRKAEIDAALTAKGITRAEATRRQREAATLATRNPKEHVEAREQHRRWRERLKRSGFAHEVQLRTPADQDRAHGDTAADSAITAAAASLAERTARFTVQDLLTEARIFSEGRANEQELQAAVTRAEADGSLIARDTRVRVPGGDRKLVPGFTTAHGETIERAMLATADRLARADERQPRIGETGGHTNTRRAIDDLIASAEASGGHALTSEHRNAIAGILTGNRRLHALQGRAGTAKTTGTLAPIAMYAVGHGWQVRAMAPTASAASTLATAIGAEAETVASVIAHPRARSERPELWIVDEVGLASAADTNRLLTQADRAGAHVILTGDTQQVGSVGAGSAFEQLQDTHPEATFRLTDIKRQRSAELRQAVVDSIEGRIATALDRVQVAEHRDRKGAIAAVADTYVDHTANGRDTLVVALSRADRAEINDAIQRRRELAGEVTNSREITTLAPKDWTAEQRKDVSRYHSGDVIVARRDFEHLARGEAATVTRVENDKVTVQTGHGEWTFDPARVSAYSVMDVGKTRVGGGDRIVIKGTTDATVDDKRTQLRNGIALTVTAIDGDRISATDTHGRHVEIDARHGVQADLGYAMTADHAQGRTVDSVIGYLRSSQSNLATQQRAYVLLSRARDEALIVTDNRATLAEALTKNRGAKETALERFADQMRSASARISPDVMPRAERSTERSTHAAPTAEQKSGLARLQELSATTWRASERPAPPPPNKSSERGRDFGRER